MSYVEHRCGACAACRATAGLLCNHTVRHKPDDPGCELCAADDAALKNSPLPPFMRRSQHSEQHSGDTK